VGKNKHSVWAQEVQYDEINKQVNSNIIASLSVEAHEALARFCQKEQKRGKTSKKRRHCWQ
jgi:hypothetical protein